MKRLLAFCIMLCMAFAVAAKPIGSKVVETYNLQTFKLEDFKHPIPPPTITTYFFKYGMLPTGTFGQWNVYLGLYVRYSDYTESPANSPYTILVTVPSPIYMATNFPAFSQNAYATTINTNSNTEYTGDMPATFSPNNANGYPIAGLIKHL